MFLLVYISVTNSIPAIPNVVCACSSCTKEVVVPSSKPIYPPADVVSISLSACVTPSGTGFCSVDSSASQEGGLRMHDQCFCAMFVHHDCAIPCLWNVVMVV